MSAEQQHDWHRGQRAADQVRQQEHPSAPIMSAVSNGPVDPHDFYTSFASTNSSSSQPVFQPVFQPYNPAEHVTSARSFSPSPERLRARQTNPAKLSNVRSQPALGDRQQGAVNDMANRFDDEAQAVRVPNEKYRRPLPTKTGQARATVADNTKGEGAKLQRRRYQQQSSGQPKSNDTSFETVNTSFSSSNGTTISNGSFVGDVPPARIQSRAQPLFGEISPDGAWNGNFDFANYTPQPQQYAVYRRSSDGNIALTSNRPQSSLLQPGYPDCAPAHKRSRSDMSAMHSHHMPALSQLVMHTFPVIHQVQPAPQHQPQPHFTTPPLSRIPVRDRTHTPDLQPPSRLPVSRPSSAMSCRGGAANPAPRVRPSVTGEMAKPQKRYVPPKLPQMTQLLSAKVVTPVPKVSPPLRSSRPRQPVSAATTAASRARAASIQQNAAPSPTSRVKPSEQWLGKPYDVKQEKFRRKIHEIGKIDFAERRARIQKAISRNLEESASVEQLRAQLAEEAEAQQARVPEESDNVVDEHQATILDAETESLPLAGEAGPASPSRTLTIETTNLPAATAGESSLNTAGTETTEFEIGDTPNSAYGAPQSGDYQLLSAATYVPAVRPKKNDPIHVVDLEPGSTQSSPSDIEDKWGLKRNTDTVGSIRIMLDDHSTLLRLDAFGRGTATQAGAASDSATSAAVNPNESPVIPQNILTSQTTEISHGAETAESQLLAPIVFQQVRDPAHDTVITRAIDEYRSNGSIVPELFNDFDKHLVDLHRLSANGGSDAALVQSLLDSITQQHQLKSHVDTISTVTPHTPEAFDATGTAIVFDHRLTVQATPDRQSDDAVVGSDDEDDFARQIRKADEEWEQQQRGDESMFGEELQYPPALPPKDEGYRPLSSIDPDHALEAKWRHEGYRNSISGSFGARTATSKNVDSVISEDAIIPARVLTPSVPKHAPPAPPTDVHVGAQFTENATPSPLLRPSMSDSARPSVDSQRPSVSHPGSHSATSLADSGKAPSHDADSRPGDVSSPAPGHKRLTKRKNIIRELLDTESTYHQDLKIIEDIYKATVSDFVTPEDRKILFGNCDEIERFSLHFYDLLRKAAAPIYLPTKNRWGNRRGSMSTTQSDGQNSTASTDVLDDGRDKQTYIGKVFLDNLLYMEQLYGNYLKNHDAANQRLSALQSSPKVKFWLDECHNNASDITSAWDLDSLLVKPTQRISKYPLILQQLLEATPVDHPDHESLKSAARDTVAMLMRINDAKKRADIVEQMISGKRKDNDMRSGLAKAFGRRTEKLKERVGISEAFHDPEYDSIAQGFGGHYVRLQVTMRDFQDYVSNVDKALQSIANFAAGLELYTDVGQSSLPEIESKWRRYGQVVRELTAVSMEAHKAQVKKRVITPLITLIKLHDGPNKALTKRKKHIVDYVKCKSIEKRGERPDKKTLEASEMFEALNEQIKIEVPKLHELTRKAVNACLQCFVESQMECQQAFERKLAPLLDVKDVPRSIQDILPAFCADFEFVRSKALSLGICNGTILSADNLLSPSAVEGRKQSSDKPRASPSLTPSSSNRQSGAYTPDILTLDTPSVSSEMRMRSDSQLSKTGMTPITPIATLTAANRPWSNVPSPPISAFSSRPSTATAQAGLHSSFSSMRASSDQPRDVRHDSSAPYVTARDAAADNNNNTRFSGIFSSAMPPDDSNVQSSAGARATSPTPEDTRILFTCASLYEFNVDKTRKEAGYSYHTYETGAIFDVIAQKGELWLAINQDDPGRTLGWIWEQHFVILSSG